MEANAEGNLLEIMDLARTLRQEQLFIQQEQASFAQLTESLSKNSTSITKLGYICAQQRRNLNDLVISRPETGPTVCCRRANNYDNVKFIDAKKILDYEHVLAYEELFNHLYKTPFLLAVSLATGDRIAAVTPAHMASVIHTVSTGVYGSAINTKDVEMILKLLRELIDIQIVVSDNPRRILRANASAFARLYHRLNESMFSAKIFLTAALYEPIMGVLRDCDTTLDIDPDKIIQSFSSKERLKRFGEETSSNYNENIAAFHDEIITKLFDLAKSFIDSLTTNWSLFPSTLRWLVQTMSHQLKESSFSDKIINEIITDMVFTHFICPVIVSPDVNGIVDAPISEHVRLNLIQIGQIIQMLALAKHEDVEAKFTVIYSKFDGNVITNLIDLLLVSQTGEDVVAVLSKQSDFERSHLLTTHSELSYLIEFVRILMESEEYDIGMEDRRKLKKILKQLPEPLANGGNEIVDGAAIGGQDTLVKERPKQSLRSLSKATKNKIAKSFSANIVENGTVLNGNGAASNGGHSNALQVNNSTDVHLNGSLNGTSNSSTNSSPSRMHHGFDSTENEPVLVFNIYNGVQNKLQPLTEEEVLKMNSIGHEISNAEILLVDTESCTMENDVGKSCLANGFDGIDVMDDVLRPRHQKTTRFSLSHDDASIGNSDNLEVVSEGQSNHSVTSSIELEENDQNDNLSDMVSANVSGRGTPNISGRDTPSSQVTDGDNNALPTPQMQKLISKARSDIEDKFCKFEIKKFEGDETVSIISDTWSTDVLASDSETLDASERDHDRNFSTPLIPSAVVLPGDNNFDVLSRHRRHARPAYLDVSDQRSESNWSTDVLASDSEKLAEVDTDDNQSITAKSDITDAGANVERERDLLAAAISAAPMNNRYTSRHGSRGFRMTTTSNYRDRKNCEEGAGDGEHVSGGSSGGNASDRSQEDSAFFDAVNSYDDPNAAIAGAAGKYSGNDASSKQYHNMFSLARSSVRTTNHFGENNFQQNYKCSNNEGGGKETFLATPRMRRQTSAESSISNQSVNLEENADAAVAGKPPKAHHKNAIRKKKHSTPTKDSKTGGHDLIDFSDFAEEKDLTKKSSSPAAAAAASLLTITNEVSNSELLADIFGDDFVEHRRISIEQRSAVFDGRRNGILAMKGENANGTGHNSVPPLRRHQSLNYENHEIMISNTVNKRATVHVPNHKVSTETEDDKYQKELNPDDELLLCEQTKNLHLDDNDKSENLFDMSTEVVIDPSEIAIDNNEQHPEGTAGAAGGQSSMISPQKPTKSTGAIPKSISFDASADKNSGNPYSRSHRSSRMNDATYSRQGGSGSSGNAANSGILNKLKHGFFKHRRGNKSHRHGASHPTNEDYSTASSRSVSFSTGTAEVSLDIMPANGRNRSAGCYDITEDILAKYRRKVSTSSEATNSDSICNGAAGGNGADNVAGVIGDLSPRKNTEIEPKSANTILHDKAVAFNIIKKKIRTVLSKTDQHTGDFRHTTYSNASPLLTYLNVQLAQALNLQNFQQISYVSEAIRCLSTLEPQQHEQLLKELQLDIQKRQNYLQYLMRYRQNLLLVMENIDQVEARLRSESTNCNRYLMAACIRLFLEKCQTKIETFQQDFSHLTVLDDKIEYIEEFINDLMFDLLRSGSMLFGMPEWQENESRLSIERFLLQRMYQQVMFPNEDADLSRDKVLSEHIRKLQNVVHPSHPALCIPQEFLSEAPWTFAQQQLSYISAYKTPKEKLQCVIRCILSIMSLLHMSSGRVPAADDVLPVLIYVVIMANPPYLLSTVDYITGFIGEKLDGEEQFHWTLFGSVVKFIKTMDYLN